MPNQAGYIESCIYEYDIFKYKNAYEGTQSPFDSKYYGKEIEYYKGMCPTAEEILNTAIRLTANEFYTTVDAEDVIQAIRKVSNYYSSVKNDAR